MPEIQTGGPSPYTQRPPLASLASVFVEPSPMPDDPTPGHRESSLVQGEHTITTARGGVLTIMRSRDVVTSVSRGHVLTMLVPPLQTRRRGRGPSPGRM